MGYMYVAYLTCCLSACEHKHLLLSYNQILASYPVPDHTKTHPNTRNVQLVVRVTERLDQVSCCKRCLGILAHRFEQLLKAI